MAHSMGDMVNGFLGWLRGQLPEVSVTFAADVSVPIAPGLNVRIARVSIASGERRNGERQAVEATLLVHSRHPDPSQAATIAAELVFALADGQWTDADGIERRLTLGDPDSTDATCRSLGVSPQLATLLRLPLVRERALPSTSPVLHPLQVEIASLGEMDGIVLGEIGGVGTAPLADARIEARAYARSARTGADGRFRLAGLAPTGEVTLTVSARGKTSDFLVSGRKGIALTMSINETLN